MAVAVGTHVCQHELWSNSHIMRPMWAGPVCARVERDRINWVYAVVIPVSTSSKYCLIHRPRKAAIPAQEVMQAQYDKGHLIGLDIGGSNEWWNVVYQPAAWQRHGFWRRMERGIGGFARHTYGWLNKPCAEHLPYMARPPQLVHLNVTPLYGKGGHVQSCKFSMRGGGEEHIWQIGTAEVMEMRVSV